MILLKFRPWMLALVLCVVYLGVIWSRVSFNTAEFARLGTKYMQDDPKGTEGYDGQFTYYIAFFDPNVAITYLDVPAYRYQRILHPLLARLMSFGDSDRILINMVLIDLIALAVGTAAMERLLVDLKVSRWYALVYGLFGGVFFAVRVSTTEPLAYGLVLLAILAMQRERPLVGAILFALAAFAKETTLIFVFGYLLYFLLEKHWRTLLLLGVIALIPFMLWQFYLYSWLGHFGIGSGGADSTSFTIIPFGGIWQLANYGLGIFLLFGVIVIPAAMIPTLYALWRGGRDIARRRWHPYVFLMFANAAVMPFIPFSTYREPLAIFRFLVGLVIGVVLYAALRRDWRALRFSTFWLVLGLRNIG